MPPATNPLVDDRDVAFLLDEVLDVSRLTRLPYFAEHDRATLRALAAVRVGSDADRVAAGVLLERLELALEEHDAGERLRDVRILGSPIQGVRMAFDLMARDSQEAWQTIAERLALVPQGLVSIEAALQEGVQQGIVAARRQAVACAHRARRNHVPLDRHGVALSRAAQDHTPCRDMFVTRAPLCQVPDPSFRGNLQQHVGDVFAFRHEEAVRNAGRDVQDVAGPKRVSVATLELRAQPLARRRRALQKFS